MRTLLLSAAAVTLIAAPAAAQSVSSPVVTGSVGYTHLDADGADLGAVTGRLGARFSQYFGVEGELSTGVNDDTVNVLGTDVKVEHRFDAAAYLTGAVPVSPNLELFARVGYGTTEIKASAAGVSDSERDESVNYGAGANYYFDGTNGVRADWTRRDFRGDNGEVDTYGLSYTRRF